MSNRRQTKRDAWRRKHAPSISTEGTAITFSHFNRYIPGDAYFHHVICRMHMVNFLSVYTGKIIGNAN